MKKYLTIIMALIVATALFPVVSLAADYSHPVTKDGKRLKYNTPYYLRDKNLPNKGGVTFEAWASYDYAIFAHNPANNGSPIVFENKDKKDGFINSDDIIAIRSVNSNWPGWNYWTFTSSMGSNSVWLSNKNNAGHKIYGLSKDNSIGIGTLGIGVGAVGTPLPLFIEFIGNTNGKAWMTADTRPLNSLNFPPLVNRQTPFQVIEAH